MGNFATASMPCCRRRSARAAAITACRRYAEAIASGEADINQCPPGGTETIVALATLTGRALAPLNRDNGIEAAPTVAFIDEERCIGCTKCLPPCPVDAIVGAPRRHAHGHRRAVHGLRAVRRALPGRLHHHDSAAREPRMPRWRCRRAGDSRARYEAHNDAHRAARRGTRRHRSPTRSAARAAMTAP